MDLISTGGFQNNLVDSEVHVPIPIFFVSITCRFLYFLFLCIETYKNMARYNVIDTKDCQMAFRSLSVTPISPYQQSFGTPGQTKMSGDRQREATHEICCFNSGRILNPKQTSSIGKERTKKFSPLNGNTSSGVEMSSLEGKRHFNSQLRPFE